VPQLAVKNALRYFPQRLHATLAPEFARELREVCLVDDLNG
jgi:urocanate hydratase